MASIMMIKNINSSSINRKKLFLRSWIILCMLLNAVTPQNIDDINLTNCELEALLKQLVNPSPEYEMHAAALRNQLRNLLEKEVMEGYQPIENSPIDLDYTDEDKRSLSSLAREGLLKPGIKRFLGSVARSGGMLRASSSMDDIKRSLATLAKNGQLPSQEPEIDISDSSNPSSEQWEDKRNLVSLAKSGYLSNGKRNIGALARDYQLPLSGKRNLASMARIGFIPSTTPKRNLASLARFNSYTNKREASNYWSAPMSFNKNKAMGDGKGSSFAAEKRNIGALKNSPVHGNQRQKRDLYSSAAEFDENLEAPELVYQTAPMDYDGLKENMDRVYGSYYGNLHEGKRFLGRILPPTRATTTTHRSRL